MKPDWRARLAIGAGFGAWFWTIYPMANWWTSRVADLPDARIALDAVVPFVPQVAPVYLSVSVLLLVPLWLLPLRDLAALALTLAGQVAVAALCYLIWPVAASVHPPATVPKLFVLADQLNLTYNSVPSLHVALTMTVALVIGRAWLVIWAVAIAGASLLAHQHYLVDVGAGLVLALSGWATYPAIRARVKKAAISRRISGM